MKHQREKPRDNYRKFRLAFGLISILLLLSELGILFYVRQYLPGGIAPAIFYMDTPTELFEEDAHGLLNSDYPEIRAAIDNDLGDISHLPSIEITRLLRNWTRNLTPEFALEITSKNPTEIYRAIQNGSNAHCETLSILLGAALSTYGIESRRVELFGEFGNFVPSHSALEVWGGSSWFYCDPTFNSVVTNANGKPLNAVDIQEAYASGNVVNWIQDADQIEPSESTVSPHPSVLFKVVIYRVKNYPDDYPRLGLILLRFIDRLSGDVESVIISDEVPFIPGYILNGSIDRIILGFALIFMFLVVIYNFLGVQENLKGENIVPE